MTQADQKNVFSDYKVLSAGVLSSATDLPRLPLSEIGLI